MSNANLYIGISQLVQPWLKCGTDNAPLTVTPDAALLVQNGTVKAAGPKTLVSAHPAAQNATVVDLGDRAVVPGFVDSHTHIVFAGERIDEMARRARGETYEQIGQAGGGIASSVEQLKQATVEGLVAQAKPRIDFMRSRGTTTCEVKSGYGLSAELELKQLKAIAALQNETEVQLLPTVLAHIVPKEERHNRAAFVELFCNNVITPAAAQKLARYADIFVENGAFTAEEARVIAAHCKKVGLQLKLHVDQLRDGNGAALAAELKALSADHLEYASLSGMQALAHAGVVATLLPGCGIFLGKGPWPDGRAMRQLGCSVAVATDCNPGSSMVSDLLLCATLASTRCGLTLEEALWGITRGGAMAMGLSDRGTLQVGERADFVVVGHHDWRALMYYPGNAPIERVVIAR